MPIFNTLSAKVSSSNESSNTTEEEKSATTNENRDEEPKERDGKCATCVIGYFGWMCCGLCSGVKNKREVGSQFVEKRERKITDLFCLLMFAAAMLLWGAIGVISFSAGKPQSLIYGTDYTGNMCSEGVNDGKDLLYYPRLGEDLVDSMIALGTDWENIQDSVMSGGLDILTKFELTGVCVSECPVEGEIVCTRDYLELKDAATPNELSNVNDVSLCKTDVSFSLLNDELCSNCWMTALNSTEILYRCLDIVLSRKFSEEECVYPRYDPDDPGVLLSADDERCITKETTNTEVERKSAYPNPIAEYLGEAVESFGSYVADVERSYDVIMVCGVLLALLVGFAWLLVLQKVVAYLVWGTIASFLLLVAFTSCYFWYKAGLFEGVDQFAADMMGSYNESSSTNESSSWNDFSEEDVFKVDADASSSTFYKVLAMMMTILEIGSLCLVFAWKQKIRIMIAIIKESTRALMKMPFLTILPWFTTVQVMLLTLFSLGMMVSIQTIDTEHEMYQWLKSSSHDAFTGVMCHNTTNGTGGEEVEPCAHNVWTPSDDQFLYALQAYHLFCYLWVNQLVLAISCCCIAGAVCKWYWTRPRISSKKYIGNWPIVESYYRAIRYHIGSLAMGAFIIALVQMLRFVMEYVNKRTKKLQERNRFVYYLMSVVRCVLWCFEKSLKYITQNAYILIAMKGVSFCKAAKMSFFIIYHNMIQLALVAMITKVVVFLGKVLIVLVCTFVAYIYVSNAEPYQPDGDLALASFVFPSVVVALISYFVAQSFLQVFALTINTLMICFIEDREANRKSPKDSFYPESLYKVMVSKKDRKDEELRVVMAERDDEKEKAIYPKGMGPLTDKERELI